MKPGDYLPRKEDGAMAATGELADPSLLWPRRRSKHNAEVERCPWPSRCFWCAGQAAGLRGLLGTREQGLSSCCLGFYVIASWVCQSPTLEALARDLAFLSRACRLAKAVD